jgi:hypothetical protein
MPIPLLAAVAARVLAPTIGRAVAGQALKMGASEAASSAIGTGARLAAPTVARAGATSLMNRGGGGGAAPAPGGDGGMLSQMQAGSMARVNQRAGELRGY